MQQNHLCLAKMLHAGHQKMLSIRSTMKVLLSSMTEALFQLRFNQCLHAGVTRFITQHQLARLLPKT